VNATQGFAGGALSGNSAQGSAGILDNQNDVYTFSTSWNAGWSSTPFKLVGCTKERPFVFIAGGTDGSSPRRDTASNWT
jgi:hypothetical protein